MSSSDLDSLLELQDVDLALDQRRHRRQRLEERTTLAAIEAEIASARSETDRASRSRDELAARQAKAESELEATEQRAAAVTKRLYGGEVSASRELQAMAADVDGLKDRASSIEDEILAVLEEREPVDAELASLATNIDALEERRQVATAAVESAEAVLDAELAELTAKRSKASEGIPPGLLSTYERLRARLGGVGASRLVGNHCDGCHLTLSAVELDRIRHLPPGELITCEQCGRILVPSSAPA